MSTQNHDKKGSVSLRYLYSPSKQMIQRKIRVDLGPPEAYPLEKTTKAYNSIKNRKRAIKSYLLHKFE